VKRLWLCVVLLALVGIVAGGCSSCRRGATTGAAASASALPSGAVLVEPGTASSVPTSARGVCSCGAGSPLSFAGLAKGADPGVVTILSTVEKELRSGRRRVLSEGLGTGFVVDQAGLVLTNHHVIAGGTVIRVQFADGRSVDAKVVGSDKHTDIAVLKVSVDKPLHALALGDSDALEVGDWVVAIGNPFGLSHTVSAGILSGKGRTRDDVKGLDPSGYFNFLQTDAAINQGNSGGPLLNLAGQVVGINTAIRAGANNVGFAIPINMVKQLLPILIRDGKIARSALGISVRAIDESEASRLGRPDRKGAWVVDVAPGGGADRAGIRPDDVIVGFDGKEVDSPDALRWWASIAGVGKNVSVRVARGSRVFDLRVTLGELPPQPESEPDEMPPGHPLVPGFP